MAYDFSKFDPRKHGDGQNAIGQADIDHLKRQGASDYEISEHIRGFFPCNNSCEKHKEFVNASHNVFCVFELFVVFNCIFQCLNIRHFFSLVKYYFLI